MKKSVAQVLIAVTAAAMLILPGVAIARDPASGNEKGGGCIPMMMKRMGKPEEVAGRWR